MKKPVSAVPETIVDVSVTSFTVGKVGAVTSFTVTSFTSLTFPALSVAVTVSVVPAFCFVIVTEYFPSAVVVAVPSTVVPTLTVIEEPISAVPVTLVALSCCLTHSLSVRLVQVHLLL